MERYARKKSKPLSLYGRTIIQSFLDIKYDLSKTNINAFPTLMKHHGHLRYFRQRSICK
jgi:hypothetical protein